MTKRVRNKLFTIKNTRKVVNLCGETFLTFNEMYNVIVSLSLALPENAWMCASMPPLHHEALYLETRVAFSLSGRITEISCQLLAKEQ